MFVDRDALVAAGIRAYKNNQQLDPASEGLTWLRHGIERVVDELVPLLRAEERKEELAQRVALGKLLLDSGDITPMGVRLLTRPRKDSDE